MTDFTKRNGTGGESIYGGPFADEDLTRPIDSEGSVTLMYPLTGPQFKMAVIVDCCVWPTVVRTPTAPSFSSPCGLVPI